MTPSEKQTLYLNEVYGGTVEVRPGVGKYSALIIFPEKPTRLRRIAQEQTYRLFTEAELKFRCVARVCAREVYMITGDQYATPSSVPLAG